MILKYKYHSDSGLLEAFRSYTLAQNNSLSDTIVITSTASDAEKYNYCLEFICYNSKSIPKAQYISPILNYDEGISFTIPNNLTEFRGHVDMQLTGYDPDDNSIVFKSVTKNCKAFDVEGSLCVLEKDLNDTPNVFTEVLKQLEDLRHIHQDIIDEAMEQFAKQLFNKIETYKWCRVKFYDNGRLFSEKLTLAGSKVTEPQYSLPYNCILADGGWYNPATEQTWNMDEDTVEDDMELYLNYITDDVVISQGVVTSFGKHSDSDIYLPEFYEGFKVSAIDERLSNKDIPSDCHIHLCNNIEDIEPLRLSTKIAGLYYPENHPNIISKDGLLYDKNDGERLLIYTPNSFFLLIDAECKLIESYAIYNNTNMQNLKVPSNIIYLAENSISHNFIEELTLPNNILYIADYAVYNNLNLKKVILEGDISNIITDYTFYNDSYDIGEISRPTLYVQPEHYANYKARNLAYEIKVIGQDYFDSAYAPKDE